jgi:flagellar motor protein MotB
MNNGNGPIDDDPMRDATVVRPRSATPTAAPPSAVPAPSLARGPAPRIDQASAAEISEFLGGGMNPLVQTASALLLLAVQLRLSASQPDAAHLREQVITPVRKFESHAQAAGIPAQTAVAARYVPLWVIAAAEAVLLLAGFVYFYSRLNDLSAPASGQIAQIGLESATPPDTARLNQAQPKPARPTLKQLLAPQEQAGELSIIDRDDGQELLRLGAPSMFASGGTEVSAGQVPLLQTITKALNQVPGRVIVVGHTDDQPIHSLKFKDNFALSAARARSVLQILSQGIDNAGRLESSGAGASKPIALPPDLPANRTRNRRVEIIYIPEG